ncbi:MAG: hypothetical protein KBD56_00500 [Candidatus Eisenbacteria bacterium]|nr:hypothetical protein [Candidatus Eisenbacteria bacterium]
MNLKCSLLCFALVVLAAGACTTGKRVTTYEQLRRVPPRTLRMLAVDRSLYELTSYTVEDSTIAGSGCHWIQGERIPFQGRLAFREIVYIEMLEKDHWRVAGACVVGAYVTSLLLQGVNDSGLSVFRAGGSSCPFVYAWNGSGFRLEGEGFGTSFGKGLEASSFCMLPDACAGARLPVDSPLVSGRLRANDSSAVIVRITNERPETHYVNCARLWAFEVPQGAEALLDAQNRAWPVVTPQSPAVVCRSYRAAPEYLDVIDLTFARPPGAFHGSLIVRATNTDLVYSAYQLMFGYLEDRSLEFLYHLENDPQAIEALKGWIEECSLHVEVERGGRWEGAGTIAPEASACRFSRIVRLDAPPESDGDSLRVRLLALADGWKIDRVEIDWNDAAPLAKRLLSMRDGAMLESAGRPQAGARIRLEESLREADAQYSVLFPGQGMELAFEALRPPIDASSSAATSMAYALEIGGYMQEWRPADPGPLASLLMTLPSLQDRHGEAGTGRDRFAVAEHLLRDRDTLLSLIYACRQR